MSWQNIDMSNVPTGRELLPKGDYTVEVLSGAAAGKFDSNAVEVPLAVSGGEFSGRRLFMSFPDPDKYDWSPTAVARVAQAIGVEFAEGEGPIAYFNRVQGMHFVLTVSQKNDKNDVPRQQLQILAPKPSKS